jgi:hypothetical protein
MESVGWYLLMIAAGIIGIVYGSCTGEEGSK